MMSETTHERPLTVTEAAEMLNVGYRTVYDIAGLEWIEYPGRGTRPIRRIRRESVERLLAGKVDR